MAEIERRVEKVGGKGIGRGDGETKSEKRKERLREERERKCVVDRKSTSLNSSH